MFISINPYSHQVIASYEEHTDEELRGKLNDSKRAQLIWGKTSIDQRIFYLNKLSSLLHDKKNELADLVVSEMGKPIHEALSEIEKCILLCDYYTESVADFIKPEPISANGSKSYIEYQPLGVVLGIMPWNFPVWQVFRYAIPALIVGNVVLLKHAPNVIGTAVFIEKLFKSVFSDSNFFQLLKIKESQVEQVIADPSVRFISFTGSEKGGRIVAQLAAKYIKRSVLELGGSNAFVVLNDADVVTAAVIGAQSRLLNTGQSCIAAKRFIIHSDVSQQFEEAFVAAFNKYSTGDPTSIATTLGVIARSDLSDNLERQINDALNQGAELVIGGGRHGNTFEPTVLKGVTTQMAISQEEIFGPVALLFEVDDDIEAIKIANNVPFGLGACVFTTDDKRAELFIESVKDGAVFINSMAFSDPRLPFGGTYNSGYGRELGELGLKEFVNAKTVFWK